MKISVVIPCYKSQDTISDLIDDIENVMKNKLSNYKYEIILVNDSSPDGTYFVIKEIAKRNKNVIGINLSRNFGQHNAIMAGLNRCEGDIVVCMDDDGQTPPDQIPKLIESIDENTDVVYAKYQHKKHSIFRNFGSKINDFMTIKLLNKPKDLYISSFFAMKSYIKEELIKYKNPYPYLGGLILRTTNKIKNVIVKHKKREIGESGYNFKKLLSLWINGFTNFSVKPLRVAVFFSILFIILDIIMGIFIVLNKIFNPSVPLGWSSVIIITLFVGSVITFILGLIGEYIGRIYVSINNNPQFVINDVVNDKNGGENE